MRSATEAPTHPTISPTTWRPPVALSGPQHLARLPVGRCVAGVLQRLQMQLTVASSDSSPWRLGTDGLGEAACIAIAGTQARWQTDNERRRRAKWMGDQTGWVLAIKVAGGAGPSVWGASLDCTGYSAIVASVLKSPVSVLPFDIENNCAMSGLLSLKFLE